MRGRMQAGALHATIPVTNLLLLLRLKPRQGSVSGRGSLFLSRGAIINGNKKKARSLPHELALYYKHNCKAGRTSM